ncbi:MAG: 30S ribosomal protein S21 [Bacteriovoracales bacterium]|nr:30S ribosomal protein S21 [Bacteriovoracales bacterium]
MSSEKALNVEVKISARISVDRSLKKFKRLCESYGVSREYKKRKHYLKPSVRKREKSETAEKRRQKTIKKMAHYGSHRI